MKRQRKLENPPVTTPAEESGEAVLYVHDLDQGISLPQHPEQIFAVMKVKGTQFKVTKDDRVIMENLGSDFKVGEQLVFDEILMVATPDYTSLGRPTVLNARVFATLDEISQSEKVIVFKKRRRKGYQKSQGHKQTLNVLKINRIEHIIDESSLSDNQAHLRSLQQSNLQGRIKLF